MDFPANSGGKFWNIGFGVNVSIPKGRFKGHHLGFEWLQPVHPYPISMDFNWIVKVLLRHPGTINFKLLMLWSVLTDKHGFLVKRPNTTSDIDNQWHWI